jgi:hypothetical protein
MNTSADGQFFIGGYNAADVSGSIAPPDWTIHSLRIYDRALTEAEVAQNAALDQIRYLTAPTVTIDGADCTNVAVISSTELQCTAPAGSGPNKDVIVTRDSYSQTLNGSEGKGYSYVNDDNEFYIFSQSINHGKAGDIITFTGNKLLQVEDVTIDGVPCTAIDRISDQELTCTVPVEADYNNNTKDILFTVDGFPPLTLEQAWTYDSFIDLNFTSVAANLTLNPSSDQSYSTTSVNYSIATNHANGYRLYIQTNNDETDYTGHPNGLLCQSGTNKYFIDGLSGSDTNLSANSWAYKNTYSNNSGTTKTDTNWRAPSTTTQLLHEQDYPTDPSPNHDQLSLILGAKVDYETPACNAYTGSMVVTVVGGV